MTVERFFDLTASEVIQLDRCQLLASLYASEGRIVLSENDVTRGPTVIGVTNSELARSAGADLILLNKLDLQAPKIPGLPGVQEPIKYLKSILGRPVGVNLEPICKERSDHLLENLIPVSSGRIASQENLERANQMGFDFICLTGNPKTGVRLERLIEATRMAKASFQGIIMVGKMHRSGIDEDLVNEESVAAMLEAGADVILLPTPGTNPGFTREEAIQLTRQVHQAGKLVLAVNGTSQDYASRDTIRQLALVNKEIGADIHHIGSSGTGGVAPYENIFELSLAIRGLNHTLHQIASSVKR